MKTQFLIAIFVTVIVGLSTCKKDTTTSDTITKPIIDSITLQGTWNTVKFVKNNKIYSTCEAVTPDGLSNVYVTLEIFDFSPLNINHNQVQIIYSCPGSIKSSDVVWITYGNNQLNIANGVKLNVQSYDSTTKTLVLKVITTIQNNQWSPWAGVVITMVKQ
jgi:hypothetical protein